MSASLCVSVQRCAVLCSVRTFLRCVLVKQFLSVHCVHTVHAQEPEEAVACVLVHVNVSAQYGVLTSERRQRFTPFPGYFPGLAPALTGISLHVISQWTPNSDPGSLPLCVTVR